MLFGSIDLEEGLVIPESGSFYPQDGVVSVELMSTDINSTKAIELQGSLSGTNWDTLQDLGEDIVLSLVKDAPLVRSYNIDKRLKVRLLVPSGTGNIAYYVAEG